MLKLQTALTRTMVHKMLRSPNHGIQRSFQQMKKCQQALDTYLNYLKAVRSPGLIATMLIAFVATNGAQFFQQYMITKWTELARGDAVALGGQYYLKKSLVYAAGAVFLWFRSYFTMLVGLRASDFYHDRMVASVFRAPMSFFDSTPSGQILSRFGTEMETIDRALPEGFASVLFCALQISSSFFALAGAVSPIMVLPIMFASFLYYKTMRRFRRAARDMKRCDAKRIEASDCNPFESFLNTPVGRRWKQSRAHIACRSFNHRRTTLCKKNLMHLMDTSLHFENNLALNNFQPLFVRRRNYWSSVALSCAAAAAFLGMPFDSNESFVSFSSTQ